ncbi:MAG: DMT family transporter [Alphaproteobacteria bacterium]|nr:MAG: DMT family transporter [Alphaproteobacteria bacterium]
MIGRFLALGARQRAILLMIVTIACFASMDAIAKTLAQRYPTLEVVWARYTSQTVVALLMLAPRLRELLRTRFLGLQLVRSAFLFGATVFFFFGIVLVGLAQATAIMNANPLIITLLAALLLGERVGPRRWLSVAAGFAGALIIIRPGSAVFSPEALLPLGAAFCYAGYALSTRFLGREENPWTSFLYTAMIGTLAATLILPFVWVPPRPADLPLMLGIGVIGGAGHYLLIRALMLAEASVIAPFSYVGLLFAALYGWTLFGEVPDLPTVAGAVVIVGAGLYLWHRERAVRRAQAAAGSGA